MAIKLTIICPSLALGGALKTAFKVFGEHLNDFEVHLIPLNYVGDYQDSIPKCMTLHVIGQGRAPKQMFKALLAAKSLDADIVYLTHGYTVWMCFCLSFFINLRAKVCLRETSVLSELYRDKGFKIQMQKYLSSWAYKKLDLVICQSKFMASEVRDFFGLSSVKLVVINNPAAEDLVRADYCKSKTIMPKFKKLVLYCGRLEPEKGVDRLIEAMKFTQQSSCLWIVGTGSRYLDLINLVNSLGLAEKVKFHGFQANPGYYIKQADLVVIPSLHESFSNVALEANSLGVPILVTSCPGGMREMIQEGLNGTLVEYTGPQELGLVIDHSLKADWDPEAIRQFVSDNYSTQRVVAAYSECLRSVV